MKNQLNFDFASWPAPGTMLRESAFASLAGAGVSVIVAAKTQALWAREMASYLVSPLLAFALLFVEYKIVEMLLKRELDRRLGYLQAFGCVAITLYGIAAVVAAASAEEPAPVGLSERVLLFLCLFGEAVFVGNIIWTFRTQNVPESGRMVSPKTVPSAPGNPATTQRASAQTLTTFNSSDWSNSPTVIFGVSAAFFAVMGTVLAKVGFLVTQVPVAWNGSTTQVPAGYLCASTALPFAVFAVIYFVLEFRMGMRFGLSATRIHFVCTLLAVLETIHVYLGWASTWANTGSLNNPVTAGDFGGALALGSLALGCFAWNVIASKRNALAAA